VPLPNSLPPCSLNPISLPLVDSVTRARYAVLVTP
jgi:hypothetical protein